MNTPSLFDEPVNFQREWREAPRALYNSWSEKDQLAYLANRDEHSAEVETDRAAWYRERAESYRQMMRSLP